MAEAREVMLFDMPGEIVQLTGTKTIGMVALYAEEEIAASKRCQNDPMRLSIELLKVSLVEADGKPLKVEDGSVDEYVGKLHPRGRQLLLEAYSDIHGNETEMRKAFLKTRRVRLA